MPNAFLPIIFIAANFLLGCPSSPKVDSLPPTRHTADAAFTYDFNAPTLDVALSDIDLKEISGLSTTQQEGIFTGIQDEKGIVYFIDILHGGKVINKVTFKEKGDFEGIECVGDVVYVLKSDGKIYEISAWQTTSEPKVEIYGNFLKKEDDMEGLCFDITRNALLLASKGNPDLPEKRNIYAFDLQKKQLAEKPVYTIDPLEIDNLLAQGTEESKRFFAPSGIAIHPKTGDVYVISSVRKRLIILDYNTGKIKRAIQLDKKILPQPEGITFDDNANLFLSSEGKNGEGLILKFVPKE